VKETIICQPQIYKAKELNKGYHIKAYTASLLFTMAMKIHFAILALCSSAYY